MTERLTPIQKIDEVLKFIISKYPANENGLYFYKAAITILSQIQLIDPSTEVSEFEIILNKLLKDGYIGCTVDAEKRFNSNWRQHFYYRTFEGELFCKNGGYQGESNRRNAENIRLDKIERDQKLHRLWMTWLTAILAVGTTIAAIYYCVELYWNHGWFHF